MGNTYTSQCTLTEAEIADFQTKTVFTADEIRALWCYFKKIASGTDNINRKLVIAAPVVSPTQNNLLAATFFRQFQAGMLFRDSALLDRIFRVFDVDDDNQISFYEYLSCLSTISTKAAKEDKLRCKCFNLIGTEPFHLSKHSKCSS